MSLFGSNSPFYIVVHEYDKSGQCVYVAVLSEHQTFEETFAHFAKALERQWVAVDPDAVMYDLEFVESTPMCIHHPHGCTEHIPVAQTDEIVHSASLRFDAETVVNEEVIP